MNINASPYYAGRLRERETMLATRAADASVPVLYVNLVGGQDELVFDGASMLFDESGSPRRPGQAVRGGPARLSTSTCTPRSAAGRSIRVDACGLPPLPEVAVTEAQLGGAGRAHRVEPLLEPVREVYEALVLGTRDYVRKNGFTDVLIGLSGGVDSSLVAAIAADALGAEHVIGVLMPSRFSSEGSVTDARRARREPRDPHDDGADRGGPRRVPRHARGAVRADRRRVSPRRTSRRACAAPS